MNLYITPHPPIIIGKIGKGEEKSAQDTIDGMRRIADDIANNKPEVIAVITPHGNVFGDALCISVEESLYGDFGKFGHPELEYVFENDYLKAREICLELAKNNINNLALNEKSAKKYNISVDVDHGVLVPLHFVLQKYSQFKLIHISIGYLSKNELYKAGKIVSKILGEKNVLVVSGDLSHKLKHISSHGYDSMGKVYDEYIVDAVKNNDYIKILNADEKMLQRAGQCAQKPLEMFIGALDGYETQSEVYSYQGPYGVGYMTAKISRGNKSGKSVLKEYLDYMESYYEKRAHKEDEYISLARKTINEYIRKKVIINSAENLPEEMYSQKNGVFVSIKKEGRLRGCIGTIEPTKSNIAQEIISNAISASTRDPRFNAIKENELPDLEISVDILFPPEDIASKEELNVKEYGVIVTHGYKKGLLLPNLEGVGTVEYQVSIALQKAGIKEDENYTMQRFKVVRHQ